ncbi:MAG TPA: hypothetical protein VGJ84_07975, partial [Polyangiaceae bacterium]
SENQGGASPHATASSFTATNPSRAISPGTIALLSAVALLVMGTFIGGGYLVYRMFLAPRAVAQAPESSSMVAAGQNPIASAKPPEVVPSTQVDLLAQKTPETPSSAAPSVAASVAPSASASASAVASAPVRPKAGSSPKKGGSGKKPSFGGRD